MDNQLLEDVFVTAIEGGSNYWFKLSRKTNEAIRKLVPKKEEEAYSMAVFKAVVYNGYVAEVIDQDNGEKIGVLDYNLFAERIENLRNDKSYAWALELEEQENGDAESSDIIFQYLIMNEVIYG